MSYSQKQNKRKILQILTRTQSHQNKHSDTVQRQCRRKPVATAFVQPRISRHATEQNHGSTGKPAVQSDSEWKAARSVRRTIGEHGTRETGEVNTHARNEMGLKESGDIETTKSTSSLILAAESGHLDVVRLLIETAADVNAARSDGYTALMCAAQNGHTDCAKLLIEAGATVNASDSLI